MHLTVEKGELMTSAIQCAADPTAQRFSHDRLFIGGEWRAPLGHGRIDIVDPAIGEVIGSIPEASEADADAAIVEAVAAFASGPWRAMTYTERAKVLVRVAEEIERRAPEIDRAYVRDFGGLGRRSIALTAAAVFREHEAVALELREDPETRIAWGVEALIVKEPVGPVLAIVPWNSTLIIGSVKIASALLAGCPVVVKVAVESPLTSFPLADAIAAAGVPKGMVSFLPGRRESLGDIAARPEFRHISFTGSTSAGKTIMRTAAENIAGVTLELGGKSPAIVLDDLDPIADVGLLLPGMLGQQAGQTCTTYSRVLVPRAKEQAWRDSLVALFESMVVGDPADTATDVGPLITADHRHKVESLVQSARDEGATILTGGGRPSHLDHGYFVEPTLIADVTQDMRIVREEVFGPVITVQGYDTVDEAVQLANDSEFGLAAGIFTFDDERALEIARRFDSGTVGINLASACIVMPFGGTKQSGLGREGGIEGVEELLVTKQIQIRRVGA